MLGPPHPELERGHFEDGVVAQQATRADVVALEGVDVRGQDFTISGGGPGSVPCRDRCPRARRVLRSALLTASALVSRRVATSAARQRSTSRRMSTARCRGARCCSAAMNASRTDSRTARSAGSPSRGRTKLSGAGWIQVASGRASPRRSSPAATGATSIGSARRDRPFNMSMQTLVAIR